MTGSSEADRVVMDEGKYQRLTGLFDRLLAAAGHHEDILDAEPDPEVREAARELWQHHVTAEQEEYLSKPMEFGVAPVFQPGQVLLGRFRVERMLGSGGMGEVYLAWDASMEARVAIKTIARLLASSLSIRRCFVTEARNARRVTHPNICRIHDLFEDGETVFFSMEYLEGVLLSDPLASATVGPHSRTIARQMAEALRAAHQTGVVHGDFKPGNVMIVPAAAPADVPRAVVMDFGLARALDRPGATDREMHSVRAGTADYMAPELHAGGPPTVRSDIYAFGKVARPLVPRSKLWDRCTAPKPEDRPESLDPIVRALSGTARRYWLGALATVSAGALVYDAFRAVRPANASLPVGTRVLVNGFHTVAAQLDGARLMRSLLVTALQQSPRIHTIGDEDLLPSLKRTKPPATLPLSGDTLSGILKLLRAAFWIEGELNQAGGRYSLQVRLMTASGQSFAGTTLRSAPSIIALAHLAAAWVRSTAGESSQSQAAYSSEVGRYTSAVPEALEKYFDAQDHYAAGEMGISIPLLREAVVLDPNFAQAHNLLALCLSSYRRYEEAFHEITLAKKLAEGLPPRERIAVESTYYRMTEDPFRMIEAAQQNVAFRPDEARGYSALGQARVNSGDAVAGVDEMRKAISLAPDDWVPALLVQDALVEAGRYSEAIIELQAAQARGIKSSWLYNAAGHAYMCLEQYEDATRAFTSEPEAFEKSPDLQGPNIMGGRFEVAFSTMKELVAKARNPIESHQANEFLCGLYFVTGNQDQARRHVRAMADLPAYPPMMRRMAGTASWARRVGDAETLAAVREAVEKIANSWPNEQTAAAALHAKGLEQWLRGSLDEAENLLTGSSGKAFDIWSFIDLAEFFAFRGKWELAEEHGARLEAHRGTILVKRWFPGVIVWNWLHRAMAAQHRGQRAAAFQYSRKVLDHWGRLNPGLAIVQAAQTINAASRPI